MRPDQTGGGCTSPTRERRTIEDLDISNLAAPALFNRFTPNPA
jgi:hypothetical protein